MTMISIIIIILIIVVINIVFFFSLQFSLTYLSQVRVLTLEVVVWTHFLNQLVINAEERDEDADHLEGLGTEPGSVRLGVLCEAGLRRIVQARFGLLGSVGFLILHPTVKGLCLFRVDGGLLGLLDLDVLLSVRVQMLLLEDLKLHHFGRRHDTDRHVPQAG